MAHEPQGIRIARLIWLIAPFLVIDFGMIFTCPFVFPSYPFFLERALHYSTAQYGMALVAFLLLKNPRQAESA